MTAVAPLPTQAAHPTHSAPLGRFSLPPPPERSAFAAALESMSNEDAKSAGAPPHEAKTASEEQNSPEAPQPSIIESQSPVGASLAATPLPQPSFVLPAARVEDASKAAAVRAGARPTLVATAAESDVGSAPPQDPRVSAKLVGERAFHASTRPAANPVLSPASPLTPAEPALSSAAAASASPRATTAAPADPADETRSAPVAGSRAGGLKRSAVGRRLDPAAQASRAAAAAATVPAPPAGGGRVRSDPNSSGRAPPSDRQPAGPGLPQAAPLVAPSSAQSDVAATSAAATGASSPAAARAPVGPQQRPPVREIDVDLAPGGLENVSMTMRLAGDRLSLVVRASSPQTAGAIEGAREAITERLAAIGQPLSAFIIQQTGSTTDADARGASNGDNGGDGTPRGSRGDEGDAPRDARRDPDRF